MALPYTQAGNQELSRLGPGEVPLVLGIAFTAPEPLRLTDVLLVNRSAAPQTVIVHVVPAGSVASDATQIIGNPNIPPNDNLHFTFNIPLYLQDTLQYLASGVGINFIATLSRRNR